MSLVSLVFHIEVTVSIGLRLVTEWEYPLNYTNLDVYYSRQSAQTLLLFSFQLELEKGLFQFRQKYSSLYWPILILLCSNLLHCTKPNKKRG